MIIFVNIGEAKTRLSALVRRALAGEEVILEIDGRPIVKLAPPAEAEPLDAQQVAARRTAGVGAFKGAFAGVDLSLDALKADRATTTDRHR